MINISLHIRRHITACPAGQRNSHDAVRPLRHRLELLILAFRGWPAFGADGHTCTTVLVSTGNVLKFTTACERGRRPGAVPCGVLAAGRPTSDRVLHMCTTNGDHNLDGWTVLKHQAATVMVSDAVLHP